MMNGKKKIEVRKESVGKAIQKLIDEQGFADIYVYCSKEKKYANLVNRGGFITGMVAFKFRCYKVEEIDKFPLSFKDYNLYRTSNIDFDEFEKTSCLSQQELDCYLKGKNGYAIHISDLEIFDKPKEISEFRNWKRFDCYNADFDYTTVEYRQIRLTKAPQNFCYVEVER